MIKAVTKSFNPEQIAKEIVNILAKYDIAINAADIIFEAVKDEMLCHLYLRLFPLRIFTVKP